MARILIVDDSDAMRIELKNVLQTAGHEVLESANGIEGLHKAESDSAIQLVITDLNMPEMDGISMCNRIREIPGHIATPMFMLTTEVTPELKKAGKEAGVMLWIVKPFNAEKVLSVVAKVVAL